MAITNSTTDVIRFIRGLLQDSLQIDGRDSEIARSSTIFSISELYIDSSTIVVKKNGTIVTSGNYTYNSDTNEITIPTVVKDDIIVITYSYYSKYSDTEIQGFLESSLSYFPQYQYKKTFEINSSNKIVAINGTNPTKEELYFIATIASISIDPQNISVNIPDLSLSAKRDVSDTEQIKRAFRNFKNFIGTIDFHIIDGYLE